MNNLLLIIFSCMFHSVIYVSSTPEYHQGRCSNCSKAVICDLDDPKIPQNGNLSGKIIGEHNCDNAIINWATGDESRCKLTIFVDGKKRCIKCIHCDQRFQFGPGMNRSFEKAKTTFSSCLRTHHKNMSELRKHNVPGSCIGSVMWNPILNVYYCAGCDYNFNQLSKPDGYKLYVSQGFGLCPFNKILDAHRCNLQRHQKVQYTTELGMTCATYYRCTDCGVAKLPIQICLDVWHKSLGCHRKNENQDSVEHPKPLAPCGAQDLSPDIMVRGNIRPQPAIDGPEPKRMRMHIDMN